MKQPKVKPGAPVICSICQVEIEKNYCSNCGQFHSKKPLNFVTVLQTILSGIFSLEHGILGVMKDMIFKPKFVVHNYIKGFRKYYLLPGQMLFYALLVLGLHVAFVDTYFLGTDIEITGLDGGLKTIINPQLLFIVAILPLFALTTFIVYYKQRFNFATHFIGGIYTFSFALISSVVASDVLHLLFNIRLGIGTALFFILLFYCSTRVFTRATFWLKYFGEFLLQLLIFSTFIAAIVALIYLASQGNLEVG